MRAYTSLLGHILGSHPEINGYYEMHLGYASAQALEQQLQQYRTQESLKPGSRYLFDKLLHNDYALRLNQPGLQDAVTLLCLRQPEPTLQSILHLFTHKKRQDLYAQPEEAARYYIARLEQLGAFSLQYPRAYYYFDAELLCADTRNFLTTLGDWLQLKSPLSEQYQRFSKTGMARAGDTSAMIHSGKVIAQAHPYHDMVLDAEWLQRATQAYWQCRQRLIDQAHSALER